MAKTVKSKNGSITIDKDFISIQTYKDTKINYDEIKSIEFNKSTIFKRGSLEIGFAIESSVIMLIFGFIDNDVFRKVANHISKKSNVDIEYTNYKLENNQLSEHEKTGNMVLFIEKVFPVILVCVVFPVFLWIVWRVVNFFN